MVDDLHEAIGELKGRLTSLEAQVVRLLNHSAPVDKHAGLKTVITYASIVVVPILVAILGGYFALKSAGVR